MKNYKHWTINETALLIYAKRNGLKNPQLAQLLRREPASISNRIWQIKDITRIGKKGQAIIEKAEILQLQVRGGQYPKDRELWDSRIAEITHIKSSYVPVAPEPEPEPAPTEQSLTLTFEDLLKLITAIRG